MEGCISSTIHKLYSVSYRFNLNTQQLNTLYNNILFMSQTTATVDSLLIFIFLFNNFDPDLISILAESGHGPSSYAYP